MKGDTRDILNGIGAGVFFSIFLSLYVDAFTDMVLPIWMVYGILAPLTSAIAIAVIVFSDREKRKSYVVKYWDEEQDKKKETKW